METTAYYERVAKRKHPEPKEEWVERVVTNPRYTEAQPDGRVRYYGYIAEAGLRVVVDEGKLFNRFFDRAKMKEWGRP